MRIMLSTISGYLSALKKTHHDDLPDYDRGKIHGSTEAMLVWLGIDVAVVMFCIYKRTR